MPTHTWGPEYRLQCVSIRARPAGRAMRELGRKPTRTLAVSIRARPAGRAMQ